MHYQYNSISRGGSSLLESLKARHPEQKNLSPWIEFYSLRAYATTQTHNPPSNPSFVTQMVYVHSKLLIVDDNLLIMGSANINDRSLLGDRDSEICVRFSEPEGKGEIARFRQRLWANHLGYEVNDISKLQPEEKKMWEMWCDGARRNSAVFKLAFPGLPGLLFKKRIFHHLHTPQILKQEFLLFFFLFFSFSSSFFFILLLFFSFILIIFFFHSFFPTLI